MWWQVLGFAIGMGLGSFAKATADRLILKKSLKGRSYCESCKKELHWYDLFPVFSYLFLKGHCRFCHKKIPLENLLAEIIMGILIACLFSALIPNNFSNLFQFNYQNILSGYELLFKTLVLVILLIVFWVDLKTGLILDKVSYPAILAAFFYLLSAGILKSWVFYQSILVNPFGKYLMSPYSDYLFLQLQKIWIQVGYSVLSAIFGAALFIFLILITKGKGMGWGDVKLVFFLGLVLGFPNILVGLFLAFLSGAIVALILITFGKKHFGQTIPFGPFLSLGAAIALIWGHQILNFYLNNLHL